MRKVVAGSRPALLAVAVGLCSLSWPAAALADDQIRPTGSVQQVVTTATDSLGEALGEATSPLPILSDTIAEVTKATVASAADTLVTMAGLNESSGSSDTAPTTESTETGRSTAIAKAAPTGQAGSEARSARSLTFTGTADVWPTAATGSLYQSFGPPPPRYGGINEGLAVTGANLTLPFFVLALLIVIAIGSRSAEQVRDRYRLYGASLRYRGRHRMPSRGRLRLIPVTA